MLFTFQVVTTTAATDLPPTTGTPVPSTATYATRPLPPGRSFLDLHALCSSHALHG